MNTTPKAKWIWTSPDTPAPVNRFHYFRNVVELDEEPENTELRFAADSNAQLWINGHLVRRKVSRYAEEEISAENVHAGPYLKKGLNTVVVLHHNWGPITCFMRTGNRHAGLYIEAEWLRSDASWKWIEAPQFFKHQLQIAGKYENAFRLRFPAIMDARQVPEGIFNGDFDDADWNAAYEVNDGPWPETPVGLETPGQREHRVVPMSVLAAGTATGDLSDAVESIAGNLSKAHLKPTPEMKASFECMHHGEPVVIRGAVGETVYATFDFCRPMHGFPFIDLNDASENVCVDFGYAEIARTLYKGEMLVREDGWINTEGVVGKYYADRCITRKGSQYLELPDERTARWMTLHFHFRDAGELSIRQVGIIKSQYPVEMYGNFSCGDERMDQIVKLAAIHAEVTMSDAYVDTPGREDGQWVEDIRLRAMIGASWFNDTRLRRFCIRTFAGGEDGGVFHPFYPSNYPFGDPPLDWSVQWVCMVYDEYLWSAGIGIIEQNKTEIRNFWQWVDGHTNDQGLLTNASILADIRMDTDCTPTQSSGLVTAFLIERLDYSIEMAEAVNDRAWSRELEELRNRLYKGFRRHHIVPSSDGKPAHVATRYETASNQEVDRGFSQAAQTSAVFADLLTPEEAERVVDFVFQEPDGRPPEGVSRWNNPTFAYRVLRAMSHTGRTGRAVRHLQERYAPYLPGHPRNPVPLTLQGCHGGPLPEYWVSREDIGAADGTINPHHPIDETGSHGWGAVILQWLHESLLGIRINEPGGGRIRIAPEAGGLPYVSGHSMTPKGGVFVFWDPQQWLIRLMIPADVEVEFIPPVLCRRKRTKTVQKGGIVQPAGEHFILKGAGTYVFTFG